jgi:hypothetical protein
MTEQTEAVEQQSPVTEVAEKIQTPQEVKSPEVNEVPKKDSNHNWDEAREVLRLQKQRIEELENRLTQQTIPSPKEDQDEFEKLDADDYMTVGKAREMAKKLASKEAAQTAKQVVQEYIQQQTIVQDEQRMRAKYEDFDYVIEHFAAPMIKNDPALAYKIQHSKNPAETAYKLAKISDEYEGTQVKQQTSPKAEKILKNSARPTSSNAVGNSLKSQAEDFSKMSKQDIWSMSEKYAKGA